MVDGAALLMAMIWGHRSLGRWSPERGANIYDSGAPDYDVYATSDGEYVAIGAREAKFFAKSTRPPGSRRRILPDQADRNGWSEFRDTIAGVIVQRTRDEWGTEFEGTETCVTPVLRMDEAARHPHIVARGTIVERDGVLQPAPAPRLSRTPPAIGHRMPEPGADTDAVLVDWGLSSAEVAALGAAGVTRRR